MGPVRRFPLTYGAVAMVQQPLFGAPGRQESLRGNPLKIKNRSESTTKNSDLFFKL